jgi:hypothetical protein
MTWRYTPQRPMKTRDTADIVSEAILQQLATGLHRYHSSEQRPGRGS